MMKHLVSNEISIPIQSPKANLKKNALIYGASSIGTLDSMFETNEKQRENLFIFHKKN